MTILVVWQYNAGAGVKKDLAFMDDLLYPECY